LTTYYPQGVCSKQIDFEVNGDLLHNVSFLNGCPGNLEAIGRLVEGRPVSEVIAILKGITCGRKATSCPDQLARALESLKTADPLSACQAAGRPASQDNVFTI